jgi:hypothetical protein
MKMKYVKLFTVITLGGLLIAGCKKKQTADDEEELITTAKVTLTPVSGGAARVFTWKDVDGPGGNAPSIDSIKLSPSNAYNCSLQFLNESVSPAEDITTEITAEAADHQVYYEPSSVLIHVVGLNNDGNGLPLGTTSTWGVTSASAGTIKITLKHKPGAKAANDPVTKGETDVEVVFPARIQ